MVPLSSLLCGMPVREAAPFDWAVPTSVSEKSNASCPSGSAVE